MTAVSVMSANQVFNEASKWAPFVAAALSRDTMRLSILGKFNAMEYVPSDDGEEGVPVSFEDPENRQALDLFYMPYLKKLLLRADELEMRTVMRQLFTPEGVRAIERGSLADITYDALREEIRDLTPATLPLSGANVVPFRRPHIS